MVIKIWQNFLRINKNKGVSGDFRSCKCQNFLGEYATAPLSDKLGPSALVELPLRAR